MSVRKVIDLLEEKLFGKRPYLTFFCIGLFPSIDICARSRTKRKESIHSLLQDISPSNARGSRKSFDAKNPRYSWYLCSTSFMCFYSSSSGVSQYKQAFSTDEGNLLVRKRPCACPACIDMDWENCDLKVKSIFSNVFCVFIIPLYRTMWTSLILCS